MNQDKFNVWVSHVEWRKDFYETVIGGDTSAHYQSHRCLELLQNNKENYLEELISESAYRGTSYDTVKMVSIHYFKRKPNQNEWPECLRKWLLSDVGGDIERPKGSQRKGRQPGEYIADIGKWEAGRDYVAAWLVNYIVNSGDTVTDAAAIVAKVYPMGTSSVMSAYYQFKKKYEDKQRWEIPDPFTFKIIIK